MSISGYSRLMEKISDQTAFLIEAAKNAAMWGRSYSSMRVGAAVLTTEQRLYTGANLSNASPALTMCAERMAIHNASAHGEKTISEIAVYTPDYDMISPCGLCRQVILELASSAEMLVAMSGTGGWETHTIGELLPFAYVKRRIRN